MLNQALRGGMVHAHVNQTPPAQQPGLQLHPPPIKLISDSCLMLHLTALVKKVSWLGIDFALTDFSRQKKHISVITWCNQEPGAPKLARLTLQETLLTRTGISPLILHEFILIPWCFMSQERDYSSSSRVSFPWWQQSGPPDPGDHIIPPSTSATPSARSQQTG